MPIRYPGLESKRLVRRNVLGNLLFPGAVLVAALAMTADWTGKSVRVEAPAVKAYLSAKPVATPARLVYPHSVVDGGVSDGVELRLAMDRDPVVRQHYAGIHVNRVIPVTAAEDRQVHVSYRMKDRVYWTTRKVRLRKGEPLLTDGKNEIRGRCGNRVAEALKAGDATAPKSEPSEAELDAGSAPLSARPVHSAPPTPEVVITGAPIGPGAGSESPAGTFPIKDVLASSNEGGSGGHYPVILTAPPAGVGGTSGTPASPGGSGGGTTPTGPPVEVQVWYDRPVTMVGAPVDRVIPGGTRPGFVVNPVADTPPEVSVYQIGPEQGPRSETWIPRPSTKGGSGGGSGTPGGSGTNDQPGGSRGGSGGGSGGSGGGSGDSGGGGGGSGGGGGEVPDSSIPEPSSLVLVGLGLAVFAARKLTRRRV